MDEHSGHPKKPGKSWANEAEYGLRLAELELIYKSSPVGLAVIDRGMRFVRINDLLAEIDGKSADEHLGRTLDEIVPELAERLNGICRSIFESGESMLDVEISGTTPKAPEALRHWLASYFPLKSEDGEVVAVLVAVTEITGFRRTEETLLLTQFTLDHASDAVFWIDRNARFIYVNDAACESLGYSREELLRLSVPDIDPDWSMERWDTSWELNRAHKFATTFETQHLTKQGTLLPVEIRASFIDYGGKSLDCAYARDISERKRAESALRESSQMLKLVLDTIPAYVFWKDRDSVFQGCNVLFATNAGLSSPDEIVGKTDFEMPWTPGQAASYRADDQAVIEAGAPKLNYEEQQRTTDGDAIWVRTSKVPLRSIDGDIIGVLGTLEDITERKRAEEALRKSNRMLAALSRVNETLVRATEESELLREVCQAVVECGGYRMAWVGFAEDNEEQVVRAAAYAGHEDGYLAKIKVSWGDNDLGRGPAGTAIRTGKLCVVDDLSAEPSYWPWREEAMKRGYGCSVSLPLTTNGHVTGTMNLYGAEPGCLEPAEENLLSQLASDLSYGITSLRARNERKAAEAERRDLQHRLEDHKRKFYRETILSVTDGKLDICDHAAVKPYIEGAQTRADVRQASDVGHARREVEAFFLSRGLDSEALSDFMVAVGEAATNAIKHGSRGRVYAGMNDDEMWVAVRDSGSGIESLILPRAVLRRGFSTKPSLGLGYSIMLDVADHMLLKTGAHGTVVVLIKNLRETSAISLDTIPDTWASIPDVVS